MTIGRWRRLLEPVLSIGAYPGEPEVRRGGRRVFIVAFIIATIISIPQGLSDLGQGYTWVAATNLIVSFLTTVLLVVVWFRPLWFGALVNAMFVLIFVGQLIETAMFGGLFPSGIVVIFGLTAAMGATLAIGLTSAIVWFAAFVASIGYALVIPDLVNPIYTLEDPTADAAFNLIAFGVVTVAILGYFVRQRDRFQRRSDDLLHSILPVAVVPRLKDEPTMIADDVPMASVLFADVVGFTPLSARMTPAELVGLLNEIFSRFDTFVDEFGLEKIKTVGDAYMVAAGVPEPRTDHAHAIADLALMIRDDVARIHIDGHPLSMRIGINSGPVTAGVIGTHKFAYDLWGDTVNTASRMESSGLADAIQVTPATYELIRGAFVLESRGSREIKGKDAMETYLLISRRA
jgi:adenylate cyclase